MVFEDGTSRAMPLAQSAKYAAPLLELVTAPRGLNDEIAQLAELTEFWLEEIAKASCIKDGIINFAVAESVDPVAVVELMVRDCAETTDVSDLATVSTLATGVFTTFEPVVDCVIEEF